MLLPSKVANSVTALNWIEDPYQLLYLYKPSVATYLNRYVIPDVLVHCGACDIALIYCPQSLQEVCIPRFS